MNVTEVAQEAFLEEFGRAGIDLSFQDLVVAQLPFNLAAVQEEIDRREHLRNQMLYESSRASGSEATQQERIGGAAVGSRSFEQMGVFSGGQTDRELLESLVRIYARILIKELGRGEVLDEVLAKQAKNILKNLGEACDLFPC